MRRGRSDGQAAHRDPRRQAFDEKTFLTFWECDRHGTFGASRGFHPTTMPCRASRCARALRVPALSGTEGVSMKPVMVASFFALSLLGLAESAQGATVLVAFHTMHGV